MQMEELGDAVRTARKSFGYTQAELCRRSGVSRATIDALENGRIGELGFTRVCRILAAINLELTTRPALRHWPTLDELMAEKRNDSGLDRRN